MAIKRISEILNKSTQIEDRLASKQLSYSSSKIEELLQQTKVHIPTGDFIAKDKLLQGENILITTVDETNDIQISLNYIKDSTITFAKLPEGTIYHPYEVEVILKGGKYPPYKIEIEKYPEGFTFDSETNILSGIPNISGYINFECKITNFYEQVVNQRLSIYINAVNIIKYFPISDIYLPYTGYIEYVNKYTPVTYTSDDLPDGLILNKDTGVVTGKVTTPGFYNVNIIAEDQENHIFYNNIIIQFQDYDLYIAFENIVLSINETISHQIESIHKYDIKEYDITNLPEELTLDKNTGIITGFISEITFNECILTIIDIYDRIMSKTINVIVPLNSDVDINPKTFEYTVKKYKMYYITITSVNPIKTYEMLDFPPGVFFDSSTLRLAGTPTQIGTYISALVLTDIYDRSYTVQIKIVVLTDLQITTSSLPAAFRNESYSATLQATGGTPPYKWYANHSPAGLTVSSTGVISGTITILSVGNYSWGIGVSDADNSSVTKSFIFALCGVVATTTLTFPTLPSYLVQGPLLHLTSLAAGSYSVTITGAFTLSFTFSRDASAQGCYLYCLGDANYVYIRQATSYETLSNGSPLAQYTTQSVSSRSITVTLTKLS